VIPHDKWSHERIITLTYMHYTNRRILHSALLYYIYSTLPFGNNNNNNNNNNSQI